MQRIYRPRALRRDEFIDVAETLDQAHQQTVAHSLQEFLRSQQECRGIDFEEASRLQRHHAAMAQIARRMQKSHLTHRFAGAQATDRLAPLRNLHIAFDDDAEQPVVFAFADQGHIGGHLAPDGDTQHFPQFDILEFGEERQAA